ncbi:MAG: prepilin-type N-terminal cleavage/methylation domain-containing protein [Burkholderiaceae bacterium]
MPLRRLRHAARGFTLIEMLVVLSVIALLLSLVAPAYVSRIDRVRDLTLRQNLKTLRDAIDQFRADRARDPADLAELVGAHYLRDLPVDPVTDRNDGWVPMMVDGGMHDLHSGAPGKGGDGRPYAQW